MFSGFLNINKPTGVTSHDVVNSVRRVTRVASREIKVGHAGTLDPLADGVLVMCIGAATRLSDYVMNTTKEYRATLLLGIATDTYDAEGRTTAAHDAAHITRDQIVSALPAFTGTVQQVPPMYSAIKKDGKKLYELARAGESVVLEPRTVTIHRIVIESYAAPTLTLSVECASGTYIRSLAHDLGQILGVGAHLVALTRTRSGVFTLYTAYTLPQVEHLESLQAALVAPALALTHYPQVTVLPDALRHLTYGRSIPNNGVTGDVVLASDEHGTLVAVLRAAGDQLQPVKVFAHDSHA